MIKINYYLLILVFTCHNNYIFCMLLNNNSKCRSGTYAHCLLAAHTEGIVPLLFNTYCHQNCATP